MNAKVKFPEQLLPFYSAVNLFDAYSLAFETTSQIQVLINRISKETARIKKVAQENNVFTELESLISVAEYLADNHSNTLDVEREKYQNALKNSSVQYDAGDLLEAYSLAHEASSWLSTILYQIKDELFTVKEKSTALCNAIFASLERLIYIAEYLADNHSNTFDVECKKYEAEWETVKNE
ncbi:hypothetical protein E0H80_02155 [Acinetobacter sp. ANC 4779]|uniref:hypothetical protein n=1 Tax=Acinetobacter sp. ANC 4779 TaxID=2529848 RepID=UPI00103C4350|nr:hypothetical protein [Acinetobacter sp. ANC 4779]TCB52662.1 hypothetical protein E0H80_02155 [Acinetobacter sp. ANC 4779]